MKKFKKFNILLIILLIYLAYVVLKVEIADTSLPFGPDNYRNNKYQKYIKGKKGDDYSVLTYWGRPSGKDDVKKSLDKIQWLSHSAEKDILWRKCFFVAVIATILILICINSKLLLVPNKVIIILFTIFLISYFSINHYIRHSLNSRIKYIDRHVQKIKQKLNLSMLNSIDMNPIL